MSSTHRDRLARGSFWNVGGVAIQMLGAMLAGIAAARILGPVQFGALGIARTTLTLLNTLAGVNLGMATSRAVADVRSTDPDRAGRLIGLLLNVTTIASALAAAACLLLASPIARRAGAPELAIPIAVSTIAIVFMTAGGVQVGALQGFEAFGRAGRLIAFEGLLIAMFMVIGAWLGGVTGAVGGIVAATICSFAVKRYVLLAACRARGVTIRHRGVRAELPILWKLVLPVVIHGLAHVAFEWVARLLLARGPNGLAEVGVFVAANAWGAAVLMIPIQVAKPAMPILTNLRAAGDDEGFRRLLRDTMLTAFGFAVLSAAPLVLLAPWIMRAYGPAFAGGVRVLQIIALSSVAAAISSSLRSALLATGNIWKDTAQSILWGVTLLSVFLALREHGAIALAAAYLAAYAVSASLQAVMARFVILRSRPAAALEEDDPVVSSSLP